MSAAARVCPRALVDDLHALLDGSCGVGSLHVHYQPVVAIADGAPLGTEALVRWEHPDHGWLVPDLFIGLAEQAGLGAALDEHVLDQAAHQIAAWDALGVRVHRVGVNVGRSTLLRRDLVASVAAACTRGGIGADRLMLEVLEHDELDLDVDHVAALGELTRRGVTLAVDDFGAGHASVSYLLDLPVGVLKLDRSLLPPLAPAPRRPARSLARVTSVISGVVAMARACGAEITAEGVETREHADLLLSAGVAHGQGWLYAKAMPPAQVARFFGAPAAAIPAPAPAPTGSYTPV